MNTDTTAPAETNLKQIIAKLLDTHFHISNLISLAAGQVEEEGETLLLVARGFLEDQYLLFGRLEDVANTVEAMKAVFDEEGKPIIVGRQGVERRRSPNNATSIAELPKELNAIACQLAGIESIILTAAETNEEYGSALYLMADVTRSANDRLGAAAGLLQRSAEVNHG